MSQRIYPDLTGVVTTVGGTAPIVSSGGTTPAISITAATTIAAGSLSASDKTKLDGITPGAAVASVGGTAPIVSSGGTTPAISITAATTIAAGSLSASDKTKLDSVTSGAAVASVGGTAPIVSSGGTTPTISVTSAAPVATGDANAAGSAASVALSDHVHQTKVDATSVSATGAVTTTSLTDVVLTTMTITPGAGDWLALFTCVTQNSNATRTNTFSIYVNAVQVAVTERPIRVPGSDENTSCAIAALLIGVTAGQAVDVRWRVSASTGSTSFRELVLVRAI